MEAQDTIMKRIKVKSKMKGRYEELFDKWENENITLDEIEEYVNYVLNIFDSYDRNEMLVEDIYDFETLRYIYLAPRKELLELYKKSQNSWFTALVMARNDERYELCSQIKRIIQTEETIMITAVYKLRKEFFSDDYIQEIIAVNMINNLIISR